MVRPMAEGLFGMESRGLESEWRRCPSEFRVLSLWPDTCQLGKISKRFHHLSKQCQELGTKCLNIRTCGRYFKSKP